ncbi:MAG: hypothetical protein MUF60_01810 [Vicinamibacterales bacterium]|nr:hypothetical protein [Vicinamibacterales bacterium]
MSPILIRPIREQIEHDRIIRVLQARLRKEFAVEANLGDERRVPVRVGEQVFYPDLVLTSSAASKKVQAIIEVETTESVNHLEAMAEWAHYGRSKAPFHLYVPSGLVDIARRLIESYKVSVAQLWSYSPVGDQVHFWLVSGDGDGTIVTSVTDSISSAEPVRPVLTAPPAEEAPVAGEPQTVPAAAAPKKAVAASAPARGNKPPVTTAKAPSKPAAPVARPAGEPAAPKGAGKAPQKPVAKAAAKPVGAAAKPAKAVARKPAAKKAAARPAAKKPAVKKPAARPAAKRPVAKKTAARPAAKKLAAKSAKRPVAKKPAAKPRARKPAKGKRR